MKALAKHQREQLRRAVEKDDVRTVKRFVAGGIPVTQEIVIPDHDVPVPLLALACERKAFKTADYLIAAGANPNQGRFLTPLVAAAQSGNPDLVKKLIDHGADPNRAVQGWTPLMVAAANGDAEMTELLLQNGASPNAKTRQGGSALSLAVQSKKNSTAERLVQTGARDSTALFPAIVRGEIETVEKLIAAGVPVNVTGHNPREEWDGRTPLETAILKRAITRLTATNMAKAAGKKSAGMVHRPETEDPYFVIIEKLIAAGAQTNARTLRKSPLYLAVESADLHLAQLLLQAGADPDKSVLAWQGEYQEAALHVAAKSGREELVDALLSAGADPDKKDEDGKTARQLVRKNSAIARLFDRFRHKARR